MEAIGALAKVFPTKTMKDPGIEASKVIALERNGANGEIRQASNPRTVIGATRGSAKTLASTE
jgi:hypothetical protein